MTQFRSIAASCFDSLCSMRRELHRHPELSFHEEHTAAWVRENLERLHIPMMEGIRGNSTVGVLTAGQPGPVILMRCDIDALPIAEETCLPFASQNPGVMHACGHDAHTAVLMGLAEYFSAHREKVLGTIKFVFQQAEEKAPGGGKMIVEDGVLDDVDYCLAWHCAGEQPLGTVVADSGPRTASYDDFEIRITGKGGHGGFPSNCIDTISTAALIIEALNQLIGWTVPALKSATMNLSHISAGKHSVHNIIPESAVIEGCFRSHDRESAEKLVERARRLSENIAAAKECRCEFLLRPGYPSLYNDDTVTPLLADALRAGGIHAVSSPPIMAAEDFAYYAKERPSTYFNVGISAPGKTQYPAHNARFDIQEEAMVYAMETMLIAYDELTRGKAADILRKNR